MARKGPNFLFIMADQMSAKALPFYGHPVVQAPHLSALAGAGVVFENAYCNYPICAPSRFSMLSGRLPSRIGAFDNAAEFPASIPTFAHYLRGLGYRTCLSGKMHFVGPDQLHGFEERLTTDIYPADFGWTPHWQSQELAHAPEDVRYTWSHHMQSVVEAGVCHRSLQLDYDEEVAYATEQKIYDLARDIDERPFLLLASFTHPHDPFTCLPEHWDRYDHAAIDLPAVPAIPVAKLDPHSRRLHYLNSIHRYRIDDEVVRTARRAYYGLVSYVDDQVGRLLRALARAGLDRDTVVIFTADHGEMLGERGMWYKMTFFEWSARVPLIWHCPGRFPARRERRNVSLVDLLPTLLDLASDRNPPVTIDPGDGQSLAPLLKDPGADWPDLVQAEYLGEGAIAPCLMLKRGRYKFVYSAPDPDQLYDLEADSLELENLAGRPEAAAVARDMKAEILRLWDPDDIKRRVIESQNRRRFIFDVLTKGRTASWDYQPVRDAARAYVRNAGMEEDEAKGRARLPFVAPRPPDAAG
jgi:choline-sulfatase